jgi:hypothetical protein
MMGIINMRRLLPLIVVSVLLLVAVMYSQDNTKSVVKESTITGEVVDVSCYLDHGAKGERHKQCAEMCAKSGSALGILTSDGKLYISLLPENHKSGPNEKLMGFIAQNVTVNGIIRSSGGVNGIVVKDVAVAK